MAYTTIDDPSAYFQTITWTGNGSDPRTITFDGNSDMQPDWVWEKSRSLAYQHNLYDSVRGGGKGLDLPAAAVEVSNNANGYISAFTSDGFTLTAGSTNNELLNENTTTYVGWGWKAGTSFTNDASGTGIGSIDSAGSVNQDAGFSICSYTGAGGVITVKHGLSTVPQVIITKNRDDANHWAVFHHKNTSVPETDFLKLSDTAATTDDGDIWNDTAPTSAIFTAGDHSSSNRSGDAMVAYLFSEVKGYSKFGNYVGNGNADGTFVYTGFKPAFVMIKASAAVKNWEIFDNKREGFNQSNDTIYANAADAEGSAGRCNLLSNGFKLTTGSTHLNASGGTFIYLAIAENPFVTSTGVPATAR